MGKVYRCYTTKRSGFEVEAEGVMYDLRENLGILNISDVIIYNRYDVEGIDDKVYETAKHTVFSEPMCDEVFDENMPAHQGARIFLVEALPGQFDQRADSCAQCISLVSCVDKPRVSYARAYVIFGDISDCDFDRIKEYIINPVECREASEAKPKTLALPFEEPEEVPEIFGFVSMSEPELISLLNQMGLAMDLEDLKFMQEYFATQEGRDPTETEVRMIDTYWSDHCRHTTFLTNLEKIEIEDDRISESYKKYQDVRRTLYGENTERPETLMDMATAAVKYLKKTGELKNLDESDEINACSVKVYPTIDGKKQEWLLMFKNETHNHPTEIEPFGGAATCLGGAIRDPLSGRVYVYQAMRVTGAGDPRKKVSETLPGKLPQRKLTTTAAAGYSSYGNQIGLATGLVHEVYHEGYVAKRMEIGTVVGAAPAENVVRAPLNEGDVVILLGGKTGRDGCGGATGSSKTHTADSLTQCGSEVQKGNPPEERKIQRLFRNPEASRLIKKCNDFGAGGVSVAVGELADGLLINLDNVPKKYEGLNSTELAISESQERMAVVVSPENAEKFISLASEENLDATPVAVVTDNNRLTMTHRGRVVVDISRDFLNSNGAPKKSSAKIRKVEVASLLDKSVSSFEKEYHNLVSSLCCCSQKGLVERFDSSIGASTVIAPLGGKHQLTPSQYMCAKLPTESGDCDMASCVAFGFDPNLSSKSTYHGGAWAVLHSVSKLVAAGCNLDKIYLTFQEYFCRLKDDPERWGLPAAALLGALDAQLGFKIASIGGKDSMSGSFMELDVPPTLVSFAVSTIDPKIAVSNEFKEHGSYVYLFEIPFDEELMPCYTQAKEVYDKITLLASKGKLLSSFAAGENGLAEAVFKMAVGNKIGFEFSSELPLERIFKNACGHIIVESTEKLDGYGGLLIGRTTSDESITYRDFRISLEALIIKWESTLEKVFPTMTKAAGAVEAVTYNENSPVKYTLNVVKERPVAVIPVFPGTNCEYDTASKVNLAGGDARLVVIRNRNLSDINESVDALAREISKAHMVILPGGFSGGDEPEGSGKFIVALFKNPKIKEEVSKLISVRQGLMLGICNGFQALIKLGLVPFGEIIETDSSCPTLTYNLIGRHQACMANTRISSNKSPWLSKCNVGDIHTIAISHGEGRFVADDSTIQRLLKNGQIAAQYVDFDGIPSMDTRFNPNGSVWAIEAITSPDGRILGKMGHSERAGENVFKNIPGQKDQLIFESGISYFK